MISNANIQSIVKNALISVLREKGLDSPVEMQNVLQQGNNLRSLLGDLVIASNPHAWKEDTLKLLDAVWQHESQERRHHSLSLVKLGSLPIQSKFIHSNNNNNKTLVSVWRGDITTLDEVDGIVNAANEQGLGCFQPNHRCIDNVIHRQAGPRLRIACHDAMESRTSPLLKAGTVPIITDGFYLPASKVIHVTGPQIVNNKMPVSQKQHDQLVSAYWKSLDLAAQNSVKSIAFPCISTGLFGFPQDQASDIAVWTVQKWLGEHPQQPLDHIVFNVFTSRDEELYLSNVGKYFDVFPRNDCNNNLDDLEQEGDIVPELTAFPNQSVEGNTLLLPTEERTQLAKTWLEKADAVLIVAGAGMSVKPDEMVYTNPADFAQHYPWFANKYGFRTAYECMGLMGDPNVPDTAKWAFWAKHMDNMRWKFTPNKGYDTLRQLVVDSKKDYFVLTSNVDACFERSGFDSNFIYTPQGEWTYLQCMEPCSPQSVYESRPYLDNILPHISSDGHIPEHLIPQCPRCHGSMMFGNVRGGSWFLHHSKYQQQNASLQNWMDDQISSNKNVVVLEIGAGFNTPTVTRFPAEAFVRELGNQGAMIRINPSDPEIPNDLVHTISIPDGWEALLDIAKPPSVLTSNVDDLESKVRKEQLSDGLLVPTNPAIARYFGSRTFAWRALLKHLLQ